jgi:hypothetical protein
MPWVILVVAVVVVGLVLGLRRVRRSPGVSQETRANIGYHDVERGSTRDRMGGGTV